MKLGILADIHEDMDRLTQALTLVQAEGVDRVVVLGDLFYAARKVAEIVDLLVAAGAVGVWGNHDLGLCHEPGPYLRGRHPSRVFDFLETLGPHLEVDGCLFSHGLPHWDARDPTVYYLEERPETAEGLAGTFAASSCRATFVGHFHRWLAATPDGVLPWDGSIPFVLDPEQRYLLVVAAVCDGWCAVFDTVAGRLTPWRLSGG